MQEILEQIRAVIGRIGGLEAEKIKLDRPTDSSFGDLTTNAALIAKGGKELAGKIAGEIEQVPGVKSVRVEGPGFINISIQFEVIINILNRVLSEGWEPELRIAGKAAGLTVKKFMVEYAHPNTHKELHIGHMRTLITGEAISRILEGSGAKVFRANYQGDIGPHVAKAMWGIRKIMAEKGWNYDLIETWNAAEKAHLLGQGYILGSREYEHKPEEIETLNRQLYAGDDQVSWEYQRTRSWSLNYYQEFYERFGTRFDKLYFESELASRGKQIVEDNVDKVFSRSQGAIVFEGEKLQLHTRVFVTGQGTPTYEAKELALAREQYKDFPFDKNIHVVANEQSGYFKVVIAAISQLWPEIGAREYHLAMGMVNLVGQKISSRTGVIIRVDQLLAEVKMELVKQHPPAAADAASSELLEQETIAAVKYSILKSQPGIDMAFDIHQSVNLEGNSGPYLQYTHARCCSVLAKCGRSFSQFILEGPESDYNGEEMAIVRQAYQLGEVNAQAAVQLTPNTLAAWLYELANRYNAMYNKWSIIGAENESARLRRLAITALIAKTLAQGLDLLGIKAPNKI